MLLITVATHNNRYLEEWESRARQLGYKYRVLGMGQTWEGFQTYQRELMNFLDNANIDDDEIIVNVDAYDVIMVSPPDILEQTYQDYADGRIVLGGEEMCAFNCYDHKQEVNHDQYKWVNTGPGDGYL